MRYFKLHEIKYHFYRLRILLDLVYSTDAFQFYVIHVLKHKKKTHYLCNLIYSTVVRRNGFSATFLQPWSNHTKRQNKYCCQTDNPVGCWYRNANLLFVTLCKTAVFLKNNKEIEYGILSSCIFRQKI